MSIGLDTNVLLRYLQGDDEGQPALAARLINEVCSPLEPALVSGVTLAEIWWVLKSRYRLRKPALIEVIRAIVENPHLLILDASAAERALVACEDGTADFADHLIAALNLAEGAATTYTFDKDAARHADFTLLTAGSL